MRRGAGVDFFGKLVWGWGGGGGYMRGELTWLRSIGAGPGVTCRWEGRTWRLSAVSDTRVPPRHMHVLLSSMRTHLHTHLHTHMHAHTHARTPHLPL